MAAKNDHFIFYIAFATMICCYFLPNRSWVEAQRGGFSVELIHRDFPKTNNQCLAAVHCRLNRFTLTYISKTGAQSDIRSNQGEYLMNISIGTPTFEILAIADTGSDLIWTQCHPCAIVTNKTLHFTTPNLHILTESCFVRQGNFKHFPIILVPLKQMVLVYIQSLMEINRSQMEILSLIQ
ncbi:aspartic proteinase CDR1-like [Gossypium australe]|uniref:Aspartic proteinase CDR1-like n=1 Tax=Gossypium australe TaxID=47621 RepID=A0A5B6WYN4_9ROSI|nr:aspartic proteinase CDR1-like [Gossypium australe]